MLIKPPTAAFSNMDLDNLDILTDILTDIFTAINGLALAYHNMVDCFLGAPR